MKRILILIFVLYVCGAAGRAQDLKTLFVALPDSLSPLLTEVNRADFGDFLESGMKAEVKNRFGNMSEMTKLTSDLFVPENDFGQHLGTEAASAE